MKTEEAKSIVTKMLTEKETVTAQEINYASKGKLPLVQIYGILAAMVKGGAAKLNDSDGKKSYTLVDAKKITAGENKSESKPELKEEPATGKVSKYAPTVSKRDLTRYKFQGQEYNKGRLAHAIIAAAAKDKRLSLKGALELFDPEGNVVPPYGLIKPIAEAKKLSKERQRFFIKPEEEIKLRDAVIAVSNQFTTERIEKVIAVARKELKYTIK